MEARECTRGRGESKSRAGVEDTWPGRPKGGRECKNGRDVRVCTRVHTVHNNVLLKATVIGILS